MTVRRLLRLASIVEAGSLAILLLNLCTVHLPQVSSVLGPVHGTAYLLVIGSVLSIRPAAPGARLLSLVPGIGGLLAIRRLASKAVRAEPGAE